MNLEDLSLLLFLEGGGRPPGRGQKKNIQALYPILIFFKLNSIYLFFCMNLDKQKKQTWKRSNSCISRVLVRQNASSGFSNE